MMDLSLRHHLAIVILFFTTFSLNAATIYGYVEKVMINPGELIVKAKLDTGAVSASLDATNIKEFEKDNERWVEFNIPTDSGDIQLKRKLIRHVRIKRRADEKKNHVFRKHHRRPVVLMQVTLGSMTKSLEVNLANRGRFNYPLLLGRKALIAFEAAVDPALTFTTKLKPS